MQILIIEDEAVAARRLERLSRDALGDALTGLHHAFDLEDARTLLDAQPIDLILLDLNLAGDDGFDLFQTDIGLARVIVVSAFPDRAIEAFGHAVLDFVPNRSSRTGSPGPSTARWTTARTAEARNG